MKKLTSILLAPMIAGTLYGGEINPIKIQSPTTITQSQNVKEDSLENLIYKGFFIIDNNTFDAVYSDYKDEINLKNYDFGKGFVYNGKLYIVSDDPSNVLKSTDNRIKHGLQNSNQKDEQLKNILDSVYIIRNVAKYEAKIDIDGKERRHRGYGGSYGTAMAYKQENGRTYLVTNEHVVSNPKSEVGPLGNYKNMGERIEILDSKEASEDKFKKDDILTRVEAKSKSKDIAVISTDKLITYYTGEVGDSSTVKNGDKILIVGFPLAVTKVHSNGEITSADFVDEYEPFEWNYNGFLLNAPISPGNSGSPVFKINSEIKGKNNYSWIGQIHATFTGGQLMNLGIDINDYKGLLENLKEEVNDSKLDDTAKNIRYKISGDDYKKVKEYINKAGPSEHEFLFGNLKTEITTREGDVKLTLHLTKNDQDLSTSLSLIDLAKNGYGSPDYISFKNGTDIMNLQSGVEQSNLPFEGEQNIKFEKDLNELYREAFSWFQEVMEYRKLKEFEQSTKEDYEKSIKQEKKINNKKVNKSQQFLILDVLYTIEDLLEFSPEEDLLDLPPEE